MNMDLTKGKPLKVILLFCIPLLAGNIFQMCYNLVDTAIVGHIIGTNGLGAVGAAEPVSILIINFANGMTIGFSIIVCRFFGAKDEKGMKNAIFLTTVLTLGITAVLSAGGIILAEPLLKALNTPSEIIAQAHEYISILLAGMIMTMLYNMLSSLLRAAGNSLGALLFLSIAVIVNAALDILFVGFLDMGVKGAAAATIIAQGVSVVSCFIYIKRCFPILLFTREDMFYTNKICYELLAMGVSMGMMESIVNVGTLILQGAVNGLGMSVLIAHTAARKLAFLFMQPLFALEGSISTFASQNYGAGKPERIMEGIKKSIFITLIWSVISTIIIYLWGGLLLRGIAGIWDGNIIQIGERYLIINVPFYFVLGIFLIIRPAMQGTGKKIVPLISSAVEFFGKLAAALVLIPVIGYTGVCLAEPVVWTIGAVFLCIVFFKDYNKNKRINPV